ncbi:hypothetical protein NIE88_07725 [Sporolactobacillus shoreicorticis]|uniref:Uncharacterized protein n=1 Tax=Sporolactobacillus shoreicorticis TaxID=1923877 RepID=A0ABW5S5Z9_9BACL|nr:hypothetical protein [Sporolactobacillus shoreicorticis]MCO7125656.1 hypothetical protein [Sporolactobacillus shoreicorticis]
MSEIYDAPEQPFFIPQTMDERAAQQPASNNQAIHDTCTKLMNFHVIAQMADGSKMEGIIEDVNDQGVIMLVPENVNERFFQGPGGPRPRFRRFNRFLFPFIFFVPPFFYPYPYYY